MNRLATLVPSVAVLLVLWQECGENPALFCYRIGVGAFSSVRSRGLVLVPAWRPNLQRPLRNRVACSNPSATCSTPFTTSKG
jgi:hypothetical protein